MCHFWIQYEYFYKWLIVTHWLSFKYKLMCKCTNVNKILYHVISKLKFFIQYNFQHIYSHTMDTTFYIVFIVLNFFFWYTVRFMIFECINLSVISYKCNLTYFCIWKIQTEFVLCEYNPTMFINFTLTGIKKISYCKICLNIWWKTLCIFYFSSNTFNTQYSYSVYV